MAAVLPAPAGMVPTSTFRCSSTDRAPRTRGDGPSSSTAPSAWSWCSPHPRGWPPGPHPIGRGHGVLPAPARWSRLAQVEKMREHVLPAPEGDGPLVAWACAPVIVCSPHPRGWSRHRGEHGVLPGLLLAPAGMAPGRTSAGRRLRPAPRTRGDGPARPMKERRCMFCSPHWRGWSPLNTPLSRLSGCSPHSGG